MELKAKIILKRSSEWMNRMRGYKVFINNVQTSIIKNDTTEEYEVPPGEQVIKCKVDWCGSQDMKVNLGAGQIAYLKVRSNLKYFSYLYIVVLAGLFGRIALRSGNMVLPDWAKITYGIIVAIAALYMIYFLTLGRNNYLVVEEDKDNVFAK